MNSNLTIRRQLLPPGWCAEYFLETALQKNTLPIVLDAALSKILTPSILSSEELTDLKGRERHDLLDSATEAAERPLAEELFYCQGSIPAEQVSVDQEEPFSCRVHSAFERFEGSHHIVYKLKTNRSDSVPGSVSIHQLGRVFPLRLKLFRVGIELFESQFATAMLGFSPSVVDTLLIDCSTEKLRIKIAAESLKKRDSLPLRKLDLFDRLDSALNAALGVSVKEDYKALLKSER